MGYTPYRVLRWKLLFILLLIMLQITNTISIQSFHDGYEYGDSLSQKGYLVENNADPDMVADTSRDAASTGERGLIISSELTQGYVRIEKQLDIEYRDDLYLSFHVRLIRGNVTFRVELLNGGNNYLSLDFGNGNFAWETSTVVDVGYSFSFGEFMLVNVNLDVLILEALSLAGSGYSTFEPVKINKFQIIQDTYLEVNTAHFDEISIDYFGHVTSFPDADNPPSFISGFSGIQVISMMIILSFPKFRRFRD